MRREYHDYCSEILSIAGVIAVSSTPASIQRPVFMQQHPA
jgi:hypothetical protein